MAENNQVTPGQLKQLICKLIAAVPVNSISFEEMERLLRDGKLQHDIAVRMRRHSSDEPIEVSPPENALTALREIVGIHFVYERYPFLCTLFLKYYHLETTHGKTRL